METGSKKGEKSFHHNAFILWCTYLTPVGR
jgi:hypothetical protein